MRKKIIRLSVLLSIVVSFLSCHNECAINATGPVAIFVNSPNDSVTVFSKLSEYYSESNEVVSLVGNKEEFIEWGYTNDNRNDPRVGIVLFRTTDDHKYLNAEVELVIKYDSLGNDTIVFFNTIEDDCNGFYRLKSEYFRYNGMDYDTDVPDELTFVVSKEL